MTMDRLLTTIVQLFLIGAVVPMVYAVYKDIKENGFLPDEN
jgi:hypothetical protein